MKMNFVLKLFFGKNIRRSFRETFLQSTPCDSVLYLFCCFANYADAQNKESDRTYRHNFICDWCWASKTIGFLDYANFAPDAPWRNTICAKTEPSLSPWTKVFGYSRDRQLFDCRLASCCNIVVLATVFAAFTSRRVGEINYNICNILRTSQTVSGD